MRNVHKILVRRPQGKDYFRNIVLDGRSIKMNPEDIEHNHMD
jgi:hypothetical protein